MKKVYIISLVLTAIFIISYLLVASLDLTYQFSALGYFIFNALVLLLITVYIMIFKSKNGKRLKDGLTNLLISIICLSFYLPFIFSKYYGSTSLIFDYLLFGQLNLIILFIYVALKKHNTSSLLIGILLFLNFLSLLISFNYFKISLLVVLFLFSTLTIIKLKENIKEIITSLVAVIILLVINISFYLNNILVEINMYNSLILLFGIVFYMLTVVINKPVVSKYIYLVLITYLIYSCVFNLVLESERISRGMPGLLNNYFSLYIMLAGLIMSFDFFKNYCSNCKMIKRLHLGVFGCLILFFLSLFNIHITNDNKAILPNENIFKEAMTTTDMSSPILSKEVTDSTKKMTSTITKISESNNDLGKYNVKIEVLWLDTPKERFLDIICLNFDDTLLVDTIAGTLDFKVTLSFTEQVTKELEKVTKDREMIIDGTSITKYSYGLNGSLAIKLDLPKNKIYDYSILPRERYYLYEYTNFKVILEVNLIPRYTNTINYTFSPVYLHQDIKGNFIWNNFNVKNMSYSEQFWDNNPHFAKPLTDILFLEN